MAPTCVTFWVNFWQWGGECGEGNDSPSNQGKVTFLIPFKKEEILALKNITKINKIKMAYLQHNFPAGPEAHSWELRQKGRPRG